MMLREKTHDLVSSKRVEGTAVYGRDGNHVGSVKELLIEKHSGQVKDVIVSAGGLLGLGSDLHSLPWSKFDYHPDLKGYQVDVTEDELRDAPRFPEKDEDRPYDRDYQASVYEYWAVTPYW